MEEGSEQTKLDELTGLIQRAAHVRDWHLNQLNIERTDEGPSGTTD
jgi:hypothetical protein